MICSPHLMLASTYTPVRFSTTLTQVTGDLPSTELWESFKVFLLDEGTESSSLSPPSSSSLSAGVTKLGPNITALVNLVLYRLRNIGSGGGKNLVLRAIAVDFFVSLIHVEAVERSKFAMAAAEAAVEAAAAADAAASSAAGRGVDAAAKEASKKTASVAAAPTPGRTGVWSLLGALSASDSDGEKAELLSVLGAPTLAVAVLDAEAVAGAKSAGKMAAAHGFGDAGSGGGGGVGEAHARARMRFPLATAAVETFRKLLASSSCSSPVFLGCASSLVSYSVAAFRETPLYPADGSISSSAARRDKAMSALAELAAEGVLSSPTVLRLLSGGGGNGRGGGGGGVATAVTGVRLLLPQLRALAAVHAWPRQKVGMAVVRSLGATPPRSPVAVDLAVLASHTARAGGSQGEAGSSEGAEDELERQLWELLFGRRFCEDNPKVRKRTKLEKGELSVSVAFCFVSAGWGQGVT